MVCRRHGLAGCGTNAGAVCADLTELAWTRCLPTGHRGSSPATYSRKGERQQIDIEASGYSRDRYSGPIQDPTSAQCLPTKASTRAVSVSTSRRAILTRRSSPSSASFDIRHVNNPEARYRFAKAPSLSIPPWETRADQLAGGRDAVEGFEPSISAGRDHPDQGSPVLPRADRHLQGQTRQLPRAIIKNAEGKFS